MNIQKLIALRDGKKTHKFNREEPIFTYNPMSIPIPIWNMWTSGELNGEEVLLYTLILSIHDRDVEWYCWGGNKYLSRFCRKSPRQVSRMISKFHDMGLLEIICIKSENGFDRFMKSIFHKSYPIDKNGVGGQDKNGVTPIDKNGYKYKEIEKRGNKDLARASAARGTLKVFLNGSQLPDDKYTKLVQRYDNFTIQKNLRKEHHAKPKLSVWYSRLKEFIQDDLKGDHDRFCQTMEWYFENWNTNKYVKRSAALTTFIERFFDTERFRCIAEDVDIPESNSQEFKMGKPRMKIIKRTIVHGSKVMDDPEG